MYVYVHISFMYIKIYVYMICNLKMNNSHEPHTQTYIKGHCQTLLIYIIYIYICAYFFHVYKNIRTYGNTLKKITREWKSGVVDAESGGRSLWRGRYGGAWRKGLLGSGNDVVSQDTNWTNACTYNKPMPPAHWFLSAVRALTNVFVRCTCFYEVFVRCACHLCLMCSIYIYI